MTGVLLVAVSLVEVLFVVNGFKKVKVDDTDHSHALLLAARLKQTK